MPTVTMPQLGESVAEGTIGKWLKQVGDHVDLGEAIVEIVTDKVNAEVPSPFEGTLTEILAGEGQTVPNDGPIAVIGAVGPVAAVPPVPSSATAPAPSSATAFAPAPAAPAPASAIPAAVVPLLPTAQVAAVPRPGPARGR